MQKAGNLLKDAAVANRWLIGLTIAHWAITLIVTQYAHIDYDNGVVGTLITLFGTLIPAYLFVLLIWRVVHMARVVRPARPSQWLIADAWAIVIDPGRLASGLVALLVISVFFNNFSFLKEAIPAVNDFGWDAWMAQADRLLHGGVDPYVLMLPIFGNPYVLSVMSGAYIVWLFMLYFVVFIACFTKVNPEARAAFLTAFVLTWAIGGNLLATVFASVGPVFYAGMGLGETFEPLMAHLKLAHEVVPVPSLSVQEMLWTGYASGNPVAGISAFPSMHVASSALLMFYAFSYARLAGSVLAVFSGIVLIGSVMLGWHYAVDGYAGIAIAWASWKVALMLHRPRAERYETQIA